MTNKTKVSVASAIGVVAVLTGVLVHNTSVPPPTAVIVPAPLGSFTDCGLNGARYPVRTDIQAVTLEEKRIKYGPCLGTVSEQCNDNLTSACPDRRGKRCITEEYELGWIANWYTRQLGRFPEGEESLEAGVVCGMATLMQRENLVADPLPTPTAAPTVTPTTAPTPAPTVTPVPTPCIECLACPECPPIAPVSCVPQLSSRARQHLTTVPNWFRAEIRALKCAAP